MQESISSLPAKSRWNSPLVISSVLFVFLIGALLVTLYLAQRSQDLRQDAAVVDGLVDITYSPTTGPFPPNQPFDIQFYGNTNNIDVYGFQIVMDVMVPAGTTITEFSGSGFADVGQSEFIPIPGGYRVFIAKRTTGALGQEFSSNTPTHFVTLRITPSSTGTVQIVFDNILSRSTRHPLCASEMIGDPLYPWCTIDNVGDPIDTLSEINQSPSYQIAEAQTVSPTNTPNPTNTPIPTATSTLVPTNTPLPTATSTLAPTNTPLPTATLIPTSTPLPTATSTLVPTNTPIPTSTNVPTATNIPTSTPVGLPQAGNSTPTIALIALGLLSLLAGFTFRKKIL